MKKLSLYIIITLVIFIGFSGMTAFADDFSPIGKTFKVTDVKGHYSLSGTKDSFHGGKRSFVILRLKFIPIDGGPSNKPNTIVNEEESNPDVTYITVRVPAFDDDKPYKKLCYDQFRTMHFLYKNACEVTINRWARDSDWDYWGIIKITSDGSNDLMIHPNQITITKVKRDVPKK